MVGRTNALLHSMVSSVNGKAGVVVLDVGDLGYIEGEEYPLGSAGKALNDLSTKIDAAADGFNYKGSVSTFDNLPNDAEVGDAYTVMDENNAKYVWDGEQWVNLNDSPITTAQINALFE